MMSKIKLVIVPCWLNLVMKELGVASDDLADCEKLSGILSPRDLLIYKMVNFQASDVLGKFGIETPADRAVIMNDFEYPLPTPTLEERASCANVSIDTLIYGATNEAMVNEGLAVEVEFTELETLVVRLIPVRQCTEEQKACTDTFAKKVSTLLHGRIGGRSLSKTGVFQRFVEEVPSGHVFY
ncbi:hypothetical protein D9M68_18010 [compost metagenome]